MKILLIDPWMGISGDMFVGALISLGANEKKVQKAMEISGNLLDETRVEILRVRKRGISAIHVKVKTKKIKRRSGVEITEALEKASEELGFDLDFPKRCLLSLIEAEAIIHGLESSKVQLLELGSADTLSDLVGVSVALEDLRLDAEIYSTPITTGFGEVKSSHGILPIPPPITSEILQGFVIKPGSIEAELTTPTGAALLKNLVDKQVSTFPKFKLLKIGFGAGSHDFEVPNVLRVMLGEKDTFERDEIYVLETNLDDVSGEVLGDFLKRVSKEVLDVSLIPTITKKNRPGYLLRLLMEEKNIEIMERVMRETGTLGVRVLPCERFKVKREEVLKEIEIKGKKEKVRLKLSYLNSELIKIKPEFEDLKRISSKLGLPLNRVNELIMRKIGDLDD